MYVQNVTLNTRKIAAIVAASLRRHYHDLAQSINRLRLMFSVKICNGLPGDNRS